MQNVSTSKDVTQDTQIPRRLNDPQEIHRNTSSLPGGQVHTNGLENFWSLFKRALKGTYTHCEVFHLQRYIDEEVFRFNARKTDDGGRFANVMQHVPGRRVTWRQLCQVDGCGFMGLE